jgi:hypothetical protein
MSFLISSVKENTVFSMFKYIPLLTVFFTEEKNELMNMTTFQSPDSAVVAVHFTTGAQCDLL